MKIRRFQTIMKQNKIDISVFLSLESIGYNGNIFYFTGYKGLGVLIIPKNSRPFLIVPEMEFQRAKRTKLKVHTFEKKKLFEAIQGITKKRGIRVKTVGHEKFNIRLGHYKYLRKSFKKKRFKDVSKQLLDLRKVKEKDEIKIIRKSCRIADKILFKAIKNIKKFKTEAEVAAYLEYETKKLGYDIAFPPIVASAKNSAIPHHEPGSSKIKKGFLLFDFGVKYKGYCSDISRTIYIGKPSNKDIYHYENLLNIQKKAIKLCKPGIKASKIFKFVNDSILQIHGLGHGVGVEIHELPNFKDLSKDTLKEGMVFTIEPGIYLPNKFGIRIEDDILLTRKGPVVLTKTIKELQAIKI